MKNREEEFIQSWDLVESNNSKEITPLRSKILDLVKEMRNRGFDKTLRVGTSMYDLVLSKHELWSGKSFIRFCFTDIFSLMNSQKAIEKLKGSELITAEEYQEFQKKMEGKSTDHVKIGVFLQGKTEEFTSEIKYTPEIESLLQRLEKEEID